MLGFVVLLIGGMFAGWDIKGFLTSPIGYLVYLAVITALLVLTYVLIMRQFRR